MIRSPPSTTPAWAVAIAARWRKRPCSAPRFIAPTSFTTRMRSTACWLRCAPPSSASCSAVATSTALLCPDGLQMNAIVPPSKLDGAKPISIAVLAMGGQGGGVLVDWIVALGESQGWIAQSTSVPGVAQRTGATVYYVEIIAADGSGRRPVLSLMPVPGEVDIVIGAELMEA